MAQITYRANLSASSFPLSLGKAGQTVIVPGPDNTYDRRVDPRGESSVVGIPQAIYLENVLPTAAGYQSIGYIPGANFGTTGTPGVKWEPLTVTVPGSNVKFIQLEIGFGVVKFSLNGSTWGTATVIGAVPTGFLAYTSTATVKGTCYIHVNDVLYTVTYAGGKLTLTDITASVNPGGFFVGVQNICSSFNYLVILKLDGVIYWSSVLLETDFSPSLITGAGSQAPNNSQGRLTFLRSCPVGFYIYTSGNILISLYTGNARYPWKMSSVEGSEGVSIKSHIGSDPTGGSQIALTASGTLLRIVGNTAELIAAEASEYLYRIGVRTKYDSVTDTFSSVLSPPSARSAKIAYLMDRYICISMGGASGIYDEALIYDILLARYGRLYKAHTAIIDLDSPINLATRSIVVLNEFTGYSSTISLDINQEYPEHVGVLLLGRYQYVRSRRLCLEGISVETPRLARPRNFEVRLLPTADGVTFLPAVTPYLVEEGSQGDAMQYLSSVEGKNISLLLKGAFDVASVELIFHPGGDL